MPPDCIWTGKGYAATSYNAWEARTFIARFEGWVAARRTTPDREAWISVDEKLPACDRKAGTLGVEVLIYPAMETGERTAFFGRRISQKPMFYRYGAPVHGVTHWMPLPAAPTSDQGEKS
ncbi:DUF551 domain-containing protein [Burkholderia multivorans]|nr:DUF551 domain-containing protein [Burkholderia multivorans]